jgi:hypothetical protein
MELSNKQLVMQGREQPLDSLPLLGGSCTSMTCSGSTTGLIDYILVFANPEGSTAESVRGSSLLMCIMPEESSL